MEKAWQVTAKADPHSPEVPLIRAQAWMARNEPEEARKVLEEACKEHPANVELWLALADTVELRGNFEEGLAVLQRAQEGHVGDCINIRLARARYWTRQKTRSQKEVAAALARLEEKLEPFKNEERIRLYRGLADIHFRWGHLQDAQRLWRQAALLAPGDLSVRLPLFDLAIQAGNFPEAEETVKEIRAIEGDEGTLWRFARASLILASAQRGKKENLQYARQLFNEVAARRNNWAPSMRALAALDDLEGNKPEALKRYALAFDLGDRDPDALRRAIQLMYDRRQYEDADRLLKKLEEQGRLPPFDLALLASLRSQQGKHDNAIDLARKAIRGGSKKPEDYIWLGQILWAAGDKYYEEAEDAFRQATRLEGAGQAPDSWVALVHFLNATSQIKRATAALEEAKRALPMPSAALALARCCEIVGQDEEAAAYLNEAATRNSSDFDTVRSIATFHLRRHDFAGAAPYFAKLLDPNLKIDEQDKLWARCFLAVCQAHAGNFQSFEQVRHFLRQYLERSGDSPDNQRLLALLLSAHPHYRREGIHILEELRTRGLLPAEDLVELGKLYEAVGDWSRARALYASQAKAELESAPKTYPRVTQYVLALVRHGSREEASYWLEPLLQRAPASLHTLDAHVKVLKAQGKSAHARGIIDKYQQRPDAELTTAALLYEEIGQPAAAEQAYGKLAGRPPAGRGQLILAEFLGRQGRTNEALDLCEQAARDGWLYQAAIMAPTVLQTANPTLAAPQFQRVEKMVESALGKYPGVAPVLLERLASLQNLQGNFAQAENIYQKILQSSAPDAIVMNNLAFLLAYRSNRAAEALSLINRAIESTGELPELLDTRALIYLCLHRPEQALADLSAAIQDGPSATLYFHLAQVQRLSDRNAAVASLKKAHELKLQRAALHPLERSAYDELLKSLGS